MPVPGGYEMLTLSTPFLWNGTDNIVLDTAFSLVNNWSNTGTLKYSTVTSGFRAARTDTEDQTNVFTGGSVYNRRANLKMTFQQIQNLEAPVVSVGYVNDSIRLSWGPVANANSYKVMVSNAFNGSFTLISEVSACEYFDASSHTMRFYKVKASTATLPVRRY